MARGFKHSVLGKFLQRTGMLESISRSDFDTDEEYERCKHELIEGSKSILMENDGSLKKSEKYLSSLEKKIKKSIGKQFDMD